MCLFDRFSPPDIMYAGTRTRSRYKSQKTYVQPVTPPIPVDVDITPSVLVDVDALVPANIQAAVADAFNAAIPAIVAQIYQTNSPQVVNQAHMDTTHTVQQHIQSLTGEDPGVVNQTNDYDSGVPLDFFVYDKNRRIITFHPYLDFSFLTNSQTPAKKLSISVSLVDDDIYIVQDQDNQQPDTIPITPWISQCSVYSMVLCRVELFLAEGHFHYMDHIRKFKDLGYDWIKYDIAYRKLHASNQSLYPFDRSLLQSQLQCAPPLAWQSSKSKTQPSKFWSSFSVGRSPYTQFSKYHSPLVKITTHPFC